MLYANNVVSGTVSLQWVFVSKCQAEQSSEVNVFYVVVKMLGLVSWSNGFIGKGLFC